MSGFWHTIMRQANQQIQEMELAFDAFIATYDVKTNTAKLIVPVKGDDQQTPIETGPVPVASPFVGNKFGMQYCFKGGATVDQPFSGEMGLLVVQNRKDGVMFFIPGAYNDNMVAPGAGSDDDDDSDDSDDSGDDSDTGAADDEDGSEELQPGELIVKHEKGSFIKFYESGDVRLFTAQSLYADVTKDLNVTVETGDVNALVKEGNVTLDVKKGDVVIDVEKGDMDIDITQGDFNVTAQNITMTAQQTATMRGIQKVVVIDGTGAAP